MRLWLQLADKPMTSRDDHMAIIDVIRSGDPVAVEAVVREHIEATIPALREWMASGR
jgi:DNA-binding GntR family transcriptional regulator